LGIQFIQSLQLEQKL